MTRRRFNNLQVLFGQRWDRQAINAHADELDVVENDVEKLQRLVKRQAEELLMLRAYVMGIADVMRAKAPFDEAELDAAVGEAWAELNAPPQPDPNRNMPVPAKRDERMITCAKCGTSVPAYRTNITASGEVCDACA